MGDLVERILSEAATADRPGQMAELEGIASEVAVLEETIEDLRDEIRRCDAAELRAKLARVRDALENPEDGLVNTCDHMPWVILGGVCQCGAIRHALGEEALDG